MKIAPYHLQQDQYRKRLRKYSPLNSSPRPPLSDDSPRPMTSSIKHVRDKFKESVRRTALPKMHNVVTNLRRSVTSMRKPRASAIPSSAQHGGSYDDEDTGRLVRSNSAISLALDRSSSMATSDIPRMPDSESAL